MSLSLPTQRSQAITDLSKQTILLYSAPKLGKSTFAGRFPEAIFFECEPGEEGGQSSGEHGLARPRRADEEDVVPAGCADFERPLGGQLPLDRGDFGTLKERRGRHVSPPCGMGRDRSGTSEIVDGLAEAGDSPDRDILYNGGLGCVGHREDGVAAPEPASPVCHGEDASDRAHRAVQG